jgi:hypothetical protein
VEGNEIHGFDIEERNAYGCDWWCLLLVELIEAAADDDVSGLPPKNYR